MHTPSIGTNTGYLLIFLGLILAFVSAMVPHFATGYYLKASVLLAGILPWLVYGIAVPLMRGTITTVIGLIVLAIHTWLVVSERFLSPAPYTDDTIYIVPIILSVVLIPFAFIASHCEQKRMMASHNKTNTPEQTHP